MADGTTTNPGSGGDTIYTEDIGGGVKMPASKLHTGAHDVDGGAVTQANPLFVEPVMTDGAANQVLTSTSATNISAANPGTKAVMVSKPACWSVTSNPGAAAQPSASKAAGAAGVRHICRSISFSLALGATAQTLLTINLRDGATGAGTILRSWEIQTPASSAPVYFHEQDLDLLGSAATAMTLEFSGATVANAAGTCNISGYDTI